MNETSRYSPVGNAFQSLLTPLPLDPGEPEVPKALDFAGSVNAIRRIGCGMDGSCAILVFLFRY